MIKTKITAHRGYCKDHRENTLTAFIAALDLGCERIEFDIHLSKDKKLVVHHDYYALTSSGLSKPINEISYAELNREVPLLDEVLEITQDKVELEIELKGFSIEFADSVIKKIAQDNSLRRMEFTSPHPYMLSYFRAKYADIKLGMFVPPFSESIPQDISLEILVGDMNLGRIDVAHLPLREISKELVNTLRENRKFIHAANCNAREDLVEAYRLGVDQLSTDELELAMTVRGSL